MEENIDYKEKDNFKPRQLLKEVLEPHIGEFTTKNITKNQYDILKKKTIHKRIYVHPSNQKEIDKFKDYSDDEFMYGFTRITKPWMVKYPTYQISFTEYLVGIWQPLLDRRSNYYLITKKEDNNVRT